MKKKTNKGLKIICLNRKASFNYFFNETLEAGIVLRGSEVKSIRKGKINISDAYAADKKGEIFLINSHIPLYRQSSYNNHNPKCERKLLLKRKYYQSIKGFIYGKDKSFFAKILKNKILTIVGFYKKFPLPMLKLY